MVEGEDQMYRPVMRRVLPEAALYDGSISLGRVMLLNEAIDVEDENLYRFNKAEAEKLEALNKRR
jgi:hypothetical protein